MSPLKYAAISNSEPIVESLIKYGADVKEKSLICFSFSNVEIVELLITHGADIQGENCGGKSPIHAAINSEALNAAELLLKHGADINDQNNMVKRTPLHGAAQYGKTLAVKWLIEHGADVNRPDSQGQTAISIGVSSKANAEILKLLLDHGATLPPQDIPKITQGACWTGNLDALKFLSSRKIKLDFDACYAALASITSPSQDLLKWLTGQAKIKNIKVGNESMLHVAVEKNNLEIAKLLIASGADVNTKGNLDRPPLDGALMGQNNSTPKTYYKEMIRLFANQSANLNIKYGGAKGTMLHVLADAPNIQSSPQKYWEAYCQKQVEAAEMLISAGADVNAQDMHGNTPLHTAARTNNILMIKMLAAHGANVKVMNNVGQAPLYNSIATRSWGDINRALLTIATLASLEAQSKIKTNWANLKDEANKAYNPKERQQIITLLDQLEQNPSIASQGNNLETVSTKIIDDAYKALKESMCSSDPEITAAATKKHMALKGTWIVDAGATEEFLKTNPLSAKDAQWFPMIAGYMFQAIVEFDDEAITLSAYTGENKTTFQILPQQSGEMKYISETRRRDSGADTLIVSILNDTNIKISGLENQMNYFLWKREKLDLDPKSRRDASKRALETWEKWAKNMAKLFNIKENPAVH